MRRLRFGAGALGAALASTLVGAFSLLTAAPASAHVTHNAGPYALTFGWQHEPCYIGEQNAVQLFVHQGTVTGAAVSDGVTLTVVVSAGGQTSFALQLNNAFDPDTGLGNPAEYDAPMIPELVGPYTFHITGTIGATKVDVQDTSGDSTFDVGEDPSGIEFPKAVPGNATLYTSIQNLQSALVTQTAAANSAKSSANSAKTVSYIAMAVAVVLGLVAIVLGRRKSSAPSAG